MKRRLVALAIALIMVVALMPAAASAEEQEVITITMIQRLPASYVVEDNPIIAEWGKRTNTIIEIEAPPISSYNDRLNIVMASGDLPDIIYLGNTGTNYQQWASNGLLVCLDDYFSADAMPNASAVLTEEELATVRIASMGGSLYSTPRVQTKPWDCILYRGDWLEKLGLQVPTTPAEYAEVMLAFATQDPDGNGANDTYGFSLNGVMGPTDRNLIFAFGIRPTAVPDADGNYQVMQAQDAFMDYLDWLHDMYAAGSLDPEWYLTQMYEDDDMFYAGKTGSIYVNKQIEHVGTIPENETFRAANPDGVITYGPPLRAEGAEISEVYYNPQIWGNYGISADTANLDRCIQFLDYGYSDECNELLMIGLEGVTYTTLDAETRGALKSEEQMANATKYCASYATFNYQLANKGLLVASGSTAESIDRFVTAYAAVGAQTNRISYLAEGSLPGINEQNVILTDSGINDKFNEMRTKYVCGQIERDAMVDFLKNEYEPAYAGIIQILSDNNFNK